MGDPAKRHVPYPDEPDRSILNKREFRSTMFARRDNQGCGSTNSKFDLSAAQSFVSAFMGPMTPYKSILLFHGVGVGKTCAAIQIAEAHSGMKHSFVIAPQTTKSGFKNNIVDTRRVPLNEDGFVDFPAHARQSCTGSTYTAVSHGKNFTKSDLRNAASQRVSTRYKFFGYEQFSNVLESTLDRVREKFSGLTDDQLKPELDAVISEIYSDRVIIVDEAHNLRTSNKRNTKTVMDDLRMIVSSARNIQLILLTATPMYNRHDEIIDLLNLLLLNDGKPELPHTIFDSNGFLTSDGKKKLETAAFGRVSHMRGDNPDTFPLRITSIQAKLTTPFPPPSMDVHGNQIQPQKRLSTSNLHYSVLSPIQKTVYDKLQNNDVFDASVRWNSVLQQHCNITYGTADVGEAGFRKAFQMRGTDSKLRVTYRNKRILSQKLIEQYSPKIAEIVSSVMRSEGTVFVYSRYKWAGVIPAAIALEEMGFAPINGKPILADAKPKEDAPRYAMITSDDNFAATGMSVGGIVARVNSENSNVKVVLGTLKAAEGLDFKRIREVHVMDPWHHMNITEQIVGRSVRYCSHASLPPEKRNVTIFLHCTAFSPDPSRKETNDEFMYRNAYNKLKKIGQVSRVLKESAIDCSILRKDLYIPPRGNVDVVTSHGKRIRVPVGDVDGSAVCDYGQCSPPCPNVPVARLDYSTFHPYFVKHMVEMMAWDIRDAMRDKLSMTYSQLSDVLGNPDDMILSLALESLLNPFLSGKWLGRNLMIYVSNVYIMVPSQLANTNFTMEEVRQGALSSVLSENVLT